MLSNYYTLSWLASDINAEVRGKRITEVFTQQKEELVIQFGDAPALVILCRPQSSSCYLQASYMRARRNTVDLLSDAVGREVRSATIHPSDRVLRIELDNRNCLYALFFGAKSNVLLVNETMTIIGAFQNPAQNIGVQHQPRAETPANADVALIDSAFSSSASSAGELLKSIYPNLGPTLLRELWHRANIAPATAARSMTQEDIARIKSGLAEIRSQIASPVPLVYVETKNEEHPVALSIIPLHHILHATPKQFDSISQAVRFFLTRSSSVESVHQDTAGVVGPLRLSLEKTRRTIAALEVESKNGSREQEYERNGRLILSHLHMLTRGIKAARLSDDGGEVTMTLDVRLSPTENAQRFFDKAKTARATRIQSNSRLDDLRSKVRIAEELLGELETVRSHDEMKVFMKDHQDELGQFGLDIKGKEREQLPFRVFTVDGGFEVWAGKSSKNNDLLTMKYAKPNDLWFHARGSSGSHVVLKVASGKGEPNKKAREQAAGIAAYYSKMKNAKMVPVAMTEKKYVRKPKGAPPGTVVIEREKVIFAEPALPGAEQP